MHDWTPARAEALRRLEAFVPHAGAAYARLRNYDRGPGAHRDVSTLSPWIRHRLLREDEVVSAVLTRHSFSAAEKFIQEVCWRTYWKGWLELRPAVWQDYRAAVRDGLEALDRDADLRDRWQAAFAGRTGIDCFDAWARELVDCGYLHNHARMWFASIWIFTLGLPWALGADFFLRHLLDGDPASNTLSWRWVAGLQTPGKSYLARADNIAKYTQGRFHPRGRLATAAPPLDGPPAPEPSVPPSPARWDRTAATGLLLTEEDLHPESCSVNRTDQRGVALLRTTARRSPLGVAPPVQHFVEGATRDAVERLGLPLDVSLDCADGVIDIAPLVGWAREQGLRQVVTPYVPVGPTAEVLVALSAGLGEHGIGLVQPLRDWDRLAWPHATRGFFRFKSKIPMLLRGLCPPQRPAA